MSLVPAVEIEVFVVFIHHLVGGFDGTMRGGIEAAPYYEWGAWLPASESATQRNGEIAHTWTVPAK